MTDRRSFFKSLAIIGAVAVRCPGVFIPKFEPVKWKKTIITKEFVFDQREFMGTWKWVGPLEFWVDGTPINDCLGRSYQRANIINPDGSITKTGIYRPIT